MSKDVFLHPDFVEEVVEELLSSDIIGKEKITQLKNDSKKIVDPNMVMDIRHKEVSFVKCFVKLRPILGTILDRPTG